MVSFLQKYGLNQDVFQDMKFKRGQKGDKKFNCLFKFDPQIPQV
jgi:hypothetical protein